jgi:hypothetical protein
MTMTPKGRPLGALGDGATDARLPAERRDTILPIMPEEANGIRRAAGASRTIPQGR